MSNSDIRYFPRKEINRNTDELNNYDLYKRLNNKLNSDKNLNSSILEIAGLCTGINKLNVEISKEIDNLNSGILNVTDLCQGISNLNSGEKAEKTYSKPDVEKESENSKEEQKLNKLVEMYKKEAEEKEKTILLKEEEIKEKNKDNIKICKEVINIVDEIDGILRYAEQTNNEGLMKVLSFVSKKISRFLKDIGIEEIKSQGEMADYNVHECVGLESLDNFKNENIKDETIVNVIKKGYKLNNKLLRSAKVIIAKDEN